MLQVTLREHTNGYSVEIFDTKQLRTVVSEIHEEKINALSAVSTFFLREQEKELKARGQYASAL